MSAPRLNMWALLHRSLAGTWTICPYTVRRTKAAAMSASAELYGNEHLRGLLRDERAKLARVRVIELG